jgi:hypothetical protein
MTFKIINDLHQSVHVDVKLIAGIVALIVNTAPIANAIAAKK